ncbi:carboxylesterase [Niallia circulans]|jgi:carboxylesterase|uniref:alpha/beta hydrolase n=1 Tax=Niallia TaxID=2837506 RepID=UPI00030A9100|nr:alpha/beta fold hydrolase [Niallia circulans]AYV69129.1 carboxylesterase [Niallia circulans]AYV72480.1 carboxylesterase [Niallia circulans]NRG27344.1 alpha/beta fold hydrolase [Niallia circulans]QJX60599.1 alpha/beta fold hydrolase [Niallia circulans]UQZ74855.1 carboxylesterase [Niallia circulans]
MTACLCIHGFTGSPMEVEPLAEYIQNYTNWECMVPTLPGHGDQLSLKGIIYNEWIQYAEEALKDLLKRHDTVYVVGFSMGGLIASYLAAKYPIKKLILLSAAAYYVNLVQLQKDIRIICADFFRGRIKDNEQFIRYMNKIKSTPLAAAIQFRKLVQCVKPLLANIQVPTLIAQGEKDGIVPLKSAAYLYNTIRAENKKILYVEESKHLICHCEKRESLFQEIITFLKAPS